ncbi:hypothetical protein A3193_12010 [Candidatus Thiodiazotropha endoloripes]|uniref:hypothetical protein n=1 Tax=Candidatus Thiodiazotropha endoloripes TaxID=1818881 RepID=UPI00083DA4CF|nr:hypothetical protein [Candidatus Thiodiazotropha endoloripes]ODB83613.1 hypothetical protein A3193_12010 [Candidatus Thiodiazotropha endoloripes]
MTNILLISLAATVILAAISSWRYSFVGYLGIVASTFVFLGALLFESILEALHDLDFVQFFMELGLLYIACGFFWFFFTMKYITESSLFDLTYQSMPKFKEFVDRKGYRTALESFTITAGYVLFLSAMLFYAFYIYRALTRQL